MTRSNAERSRDYRARLRGGPARVPQPCGTPAAYLRHRRRQEPACDACRAAWSTRQAARRLGC